jgi:hypothetical protein
VEDTFDAVPISAALILKSEACSLECSLEVGCAIDEKHRVLDVVFLSQLSEKDLG